MSLPGGLTAGQVLINEAGFRLTELNQTAAGESRLASILLPPRILHCVSECRIPTGLRERAYIWLL